MDSRPPEPIEVGAYYVVSEALTNAVKHSEATTITVDVAAGDDWLRVRVQDDGVGGAEFAGGSGSSGWGQSRGARRPNCAAEQPSLGTSVSVELPLSPDPAALASPVVAASVPPADARTPHLSDSGPPSPPPRPHELLPPLGSPSSSSTARPWARPPASPCLEVLDRPGRRAKASRLRGPQYSRPRLPYLFAPRPTLDAVAPVNPPAPPAPRSPGARPPTAPSCRPWPRVPTALPHTPPHSRRPPPAPPRLPSSPRHRDAPSTGSRSLPVGPSSPPLAVFWLSCAFPSQSLSRGSSPPPPPAPQHRSPPLPSPRRRRDRPSIRPPSSRATPR